MRYLKILIALLILCFGIVIGIIINDIPLFKLNPEIKVFEPLTFILTATIGVLIPFFIKRWIDDSRQIKNNLIDELKSTLKEYEIIKDKIRFCYNNKTISKSDKDEVNVLFEQADLRYNCLKQQMIEAFDKETKCIRDEIHNGCIDYWKHTTSAEMMSSKFKVVSETFYRQHNEIFLKFETIIKKAIIKVQKI